MKKSKKPKKFIEKTFYPGGNDALKLFLAKNLNYPEDARKNNIEGIVSLKVDINYKGEVTRAKVKKGIGFGCDEEAIRVAKLLRFLPTANRGLRVTFHKNLRFRFSPSKPKAQAPKSKRIQYVLSPKTKATVAPSTKKGNTIYTITIKK